MKEELLKDLRCATWNIHRAKGRDGRVDPDRVVSAIGSALAPLGLDVLALQEADGERRPHPRIVDIARIAELTGLACIHERPEMRWGPESGGFLGTVLFLHPHLRRIHADVIDLPGHCHRGAVSVEALRDGRNCRIISSHLSLSQPLRIVQMRIIGQYLCRRPQMQTILLGDLNEWRPWGGFAFARGFVGTRFCGPAPRTFPAARPLLPLDRILTDAPGTVRDVEVIDDPATNAASDHRPLVGVVTVA